MVLERLRGLDRVAYIRFASVYRDFADIESFKEEVEALQESLDRQVPNPQLPLMPEKVSNRPKRGRKPRITPAMLLNMSQKNNFPN